MSDGVRLPQLGIGTWRLNDIQAAEAVERALRSGCRMIVTAARYENEKGVGHGVIASEIARSEIFVITKLRGSSHGYDKTLLAFEQSLKRIGMDCLDLYLIHWPQPMKDLYVDTWRAFVRLKEDGRVRSIGVSNFLPAHINQIVRETGVVPAINQIELHPAFAQVDLRRWLAAEGIAIQSWSPLGAGTQLSHPVIQRLASKYRCTTAQLILRWHSQNGLSAIPKSQNPEHIQQNYNSCDFALDEMDLGLIASLDRGERLGADPSKFSDD